MVLAGLLVYVLVLMASPALHHDLDCHLKTPGHCPACIANPVAFGAESAGSLGATTFLLAELIERPGATDPEPPSLARLSGRSPPA